MIKKVKVHKMFEEFHILPVIQYVGEFDDKGRLIRLYNSINQELDRIYGTSQWILNGTEEVYFVEGDSNFQAETI
ncbi:hypothetical protein [Acinetobacter shaoyimingii]|uniref:hypothetical protein n=1 Tax=Acinetobacter shaoyimingii TaxID=2715164 RepID=UPI001D0EBC1D|nr:hypothetical protein [Acinetobacter shaoyimingii]